MNIHLSKQLLHWNSLYQQLNETYRQYATQKGVSETTLWLLYFLCEQGPSRLKSNILICFAPLFDTIMWELYAS